MKIIKLNKEKYFTITSSYDEFGKDYFKDIVEVYALQLDEQQDQYNYEIYLRNKKESIIEMINNGSYDLMININEVEEWKQA